MRIEIDIRRTGHQRRERKHKQSDHRRQQNLDEQQRYLKLPTMISQLLSKVRSTISGFTRVSEMLAMILICVYAIISFFPSLVPCLVVTPVNTNTYPWMFATASFVEKSASGLVLSTVCILWVGKCLEIVWGSPEFLKFIVFVAFSTSVCLVIATGYICFIIRNYKYLYVQYSGFYGVLGGFLIAIKQQMPDHEICLAYNVRTKAKKFPFLVLLLATCERCLMPYSASYYLTLICGFYASWFYLRFIQWNQETNRRGDPSPDFSFLSFFPKVFRTVIYVIIYAFDLLSVKPFLRRRSEIAEASRRRDRGGTRSNELRVAAERPAGRSLEGREREARALEENLASERIPEGRERTSGVLEEILAAEMLARNSSEAPFHGIIIPGAA